MNIRWLFFAVFAALLTFSGGAQDAALAGVLGVVYYDNAAAPTLSRRVFTLHTFDGRDIQLDIPDGVLAAAGGIFAIQHAPIEIIPDGALTRGGALRAAAIRPAAGPRWYDVDPSGTVPWTVLPCKFSDKVAYTPFTQANAQMMFGPNPGLAGYWSEVSHDTTTISATVNDWAILPKTLAQYKALDWGPRLDAVLADCAAAHGIATDGAYSIVVEFNGDAFDGYSVGGYGYFGSALQRRVWHSISEGGGFYEGLVAHEMGHAYGLPHSNNNDGLPGDTNDNAWDVMSWAYEGTIDPVIGHLPPPTNSYYFQQIGMLPADDRFTLPTGSRTTLTIDRWGVADTANLHLVKIPIPGSGRFFTVETRKASGGGYEGNVIGDGVLLYQIDPLRPEPAWMVLDTEATPFVFDPAYALTPGEVYVNKSSKVYVYVESETPDGYVVRVAQAVPLFDVEIVQPAGASTVTTAAATFEWLPVPGATKYKLKLTEVGAQTITFSTTNAACAATCIYGFDPAAHSWMWHEGAAYTWSVEAKDQTGAQLGKSAKSPFTFDALPSSIALLAPDDDAGDPDGTVMFTWVDDPDFSEYRVVIARKNGTTISKQWLLRAAVCTPDCAFTFALPSPDKTYTWRVQGRASGISGSVRSEKRTILFAS